ncbi:MAG: hypothetical protein PHR16_13835 [Methylovulum sp.]|nr:hypothetical protein [Methylovulum sp.]
MIPKQQLRTARIIQEAMLCYCFDISKAHYRSALQADKAEPSKPFVIAQTRSGTCACDIKNPSRQGCLARLKQVERAYLGS